MSVSVLWTVGTDIDEDDEEPLFQLSQWSSSRPSDHRIKVDYLGESLQCQFSVDRYLSPSSSADEVYSSIEPHLLGVLHGLKGAGFVRLGPRPPKLPLGVLFGEMPLWDPSQPEGSELQIRATDGIAVRIVKRMFGEMQHVVRNGREAYSVKMGLSCFMNTPTKPTDLLKNIRQQVPPELEWGDAEGVLPGKYIYATAASDVLRTLTKLLSSASFSPVMHRLSYCLHLIVLKSSAGVPPAAAVDAKVSHLMFLDIHPDHTPIAQRALGPLLQQMAKERPDSGVVVEGRGFSNTPLSPRGASIASDYRAADGVLGRCLGVLRNTVPYNRLVLLAAARHGGPLTAQQQVQMDAMVGVLESAQKSGPALPPPTSYYTRDPFRSLSIPSYSIAERSTTPAPPILAPASVENSPSPRMSPSIRRAASPPHALQAEDRHTSPHRPPSPTDSRAKQNPYISPKAPSPRERTSPLTSPVNSSRPPSPAAESRRLSPANSAGKEDRRTSPMISAAKDEIRRLEREVVEMRREISPAIRPSPTVRSVIESPLRSVAESPALVPDEVSIRLTTECQALRIENEALRRQLEQRTEELDEAVRAAISSKSTEAQGEVRRLQMDLAIRQSHIKELQAQIGILEKKLLEGNEQEAWHVRFEAEADKREIETLRLELEGERKRGAAECNAWRERVAAAEAAWNSHVKELQTMLTKQQSELRDMPNDAILTKQLREMQNRVLDLEQALAKTEHSRDDMALRARQANNDADEAKAHTLSMRGTIRELEARLQSEAMARDSAEKDAGRLQVSLQTTLEQLASSRRIASEAEMEVRVTRSEMDTARMQVTELAMELETERTNSRRLRMLLEGTNAIERDRVEEREAADRARLWADFIDGLHWLAHTCLRWSHLRSISPMSTALVSPSAKRMDDTMILRDKLAQRESQLYAKNAEVGQLEQQVVEAHEKLRDMRHVMQDEMGHLEGRLRMVTLEKGELELRVQGMEDELRRATAMVKGTESERVELCDQLRRLRSEYSALQEALEDAMREKVVMADESEALRRREKDQGRDLRRKEKELSRATTELQQREAKILEMERRAMALQVQLEERNKAEWERRQLETSLAEIDNARNHQQAEIDALRRHLQEAEGERRALKAREEELVSKFEAREREIRSLRLDRERLEAERQSRVHWERGVQEEIREKTQTLDSIERLLEAEQSKEAQRDRELASLQTQLASSRDEVLSLQHKVARLEDDLKSAKSLEQVLRTELGRARDKVHRHISPSRPRPELAKRSPVEGQLSPLHPSRPYSKRSPHPHSPSSSSSDETSPGKIVTTRSRWRLQEKLAAVEQENVELRRQREAELSRMRNTAATPPPPSTLPPPAVARAERQIAQMQSDLAALPIPLPTSIPSSSTVVTAPLSARGARTAEVSTPSHSARPMLLSPTDRKAPGPAAAIPFPIPSPSIQTIQGQSPRLVY